MRRIALSCRGIEKIYNPGTLLETHALVKSDLDLRAGRFYAIVGRSGSGKSTLMHILGGLDRPTSGQVIIDNCSLFDMSDSELATLRRKKIGFVFQAFNLLSEHTVYENIVMPLTLDHEKPDREHLSKIVKALGIDDKLSRYPSQLSGGEQQRVAIARALVTKPTIVRADEPTGNLDPKTGDEVLRLLKELSAELRQTVILVTHDMQIAALADRIIKLDAGHIEYDAQEEEEEDAWVQERGEPEDVLVCMELSKTYNKGRTNEVQALKSCSFSVRRGEYCAIIGRSGSGKSTLMHLLGALDKPTSGTVMLENKSLFEQSESELSRIRRERIGFVFQSCNLLPEHTVYENITMPLDIVSTPVDSDYIDRLVHTLKIDAKLMSYPSELSGGEQQRVAIARALAAKPAIVLADEPTGNLDPKTGDEVIRLLRDLAHRFNQTIMIVTHDTDIASQADRRIKLDSGVMTAEW